MTGEQNSRPSRRPGTAPGSLAGVPRPAALPADRQHRQAQLLLMDEGRMQQLQNDLRIAGLYVNSRHLEMLSPPVGDSLYRAAVRPLSAAQHSRDGISIYHIRKLMYNEEEDSFEKLVSVYSALNSFGGAAAMILQSDGRNADLYLCTSTSGSSAIAGQLLAGNLRGQFPGCQIEALAPADRDQLLDGLGSTAPSCTVRSLSMIPSRREDERQHDKKFSAQGYEKFVDAMSGRRYSLVVLSQSVSAAAMEESVNGLENLFTCLSPYGRESVTYSENQSDAVSAALSSSISSSLGRSLSRSFGTSHTSSINQGSSRSGNATFTLFDTHLTGGRGSSFGTSSADGVTSSTGSGTSRSDSWSTGGSESRSSTAGSARSITLNRDNKAVQDLLAKIEEHIRRIQLSQTFGMWNSACYLIADDAATAAMGTSTLAALFSGDAPAAPRAYYNQWDITAPGERDQVLDCLQHLQHPVIDLTMLQEFTEPGGAVKRVPCPPQQITPGIMVSGRELPTLMGLPRKSVPGIVVDRMAEFGRNIPVTWCKSVRRPVTLGNVYHMGQPEPAPVVLDLDLFASHVLVCGASGSGKSNTDYNLLAELIRWKVPFLVIEPAKGEYKTEFAALHGVSIYTAGESAFGSLQLNPFEFNPGIHIREHLDSILEVVSACWPLYGAMPGLLKTAFEEVYLEHGWDLEHSERILERGSRFPTFRDLARVLDRVIQEAPFSSQTRSDYRGALLNRVSSLCNGFEGQIFGRSRGIPERVLFAQNTIIDLSSINSEETRALIMGMLVIKLKNYRKACAGAPNSPLIHVTVLEEAHNLLRRCSQETSTDSSNIQGTAVAGLCRCIAEMRSAGEGFMIVDQSPTAVDETAIKNTATKIVMRLSTKKDCEEIGTALNLTDEQVRELSRLEPGVAAVFQNGWPDTILARMGSVWDKRYRLEKPLVLSQLTWTRVQGAVLQLMYRDIHSGETGSILDDVRELVELLCGGSGSGLPAPRQAQLLDEVQCFLEDSELLIRAGRVRELERQFFAFALSFLRLQSVMRMSRLTAVSGRMEDPLKPAGLTPKESRAAMQWEEEVRRGVLHYLNMPAECDPSGSYRWPSDPSCAEYFWPIYYGILQRYSHSAALGAAGTYCYVRALDYLRSIGRFDPSTNRKK